MMTFIWLIVWLVKGTHALHLWNNWMISLVVCAGLDFFGWLGDRGRRQRRKIVFEIRHNDNHEI